MLCHTIARGNFLGRLFKLSKSAVAMVFSVVLVKLHISIRTSRFMGWYGSAIKSRKRTDKNPLP